MINLFDAFLLILFAAVCAWLWRGHGIRERALQLAAERDQDNIVSLPGAIEAHTTQQIYVALTLPPEMKVLSHDDHPDSKSLHQNLGYENFGLLAGPCLVENHHLGEFHPCGSQLFELLV